MVGENSPTPTSCLPCMLVEVVSPYAHTSVHTHINKCKNTSIRKFTLWHQFFLPKSITDDKQKSKLYLSRAAHISPPGKQALKTSSTLCSLQDACWFKTVQLWLAWNFVMQTMLVQNSEIHQPLSPKRQDPRCVTPQLVKDIMCMSTCPNICMCTL